MLGALCGSRDADAAAVVVTSSLMNSFHNGGSWQNSFLYTVNLDSTVPNETLYAGSTLQLNTQSYTFYDPFNSSLNLSTNGSLGGFSILSSYRAGAIGSSFGSFQFVGTSFTPYSSSDVPPTSGSLTLATIPEPSVYALVALGVVALLLISRGGWDGAVLKGCFPVFLSEKADRASSRGGGYGA